MADSLEITCPCCEAMLVVDRTSGEILLHQAKQRSSKRSFEEMVSEIDAQRADRERLFEKVMASQKNRKEVLDARFREVLQRADKDDDTPRPSPLDLD